MVAHYDGPESAERAKFLREHLWQPFGVVGQGAPQPAVALPTASRTPAPATQYLAGADLCGLASGLIEALKSCGATVPEGMQSAELEPHVYRAALKAGLLATFAEAAEVLAIDIRTLERWAESEHIQVARLEGRRYILKAQVNELAQCLTPEEVGKQFGITARQVRNLIHDGKIQGAIALGKKWLVPLASFRRAKKLLEK